MDMLPANRTRGTDVRAHRTSLLLCWVAFFAGAQRYLTAESLVIGPGDQLHIQVFETPDLEQHPRVTDAGDVPLILLGNVHVIGLTPAQASALIEQDLINGKFMRHPQVTVTIEQYATQNVSVLGEVKQPGSFAISAPRSVIDLIALAGGLTTLANRSITIERNNDPAQKVNYFLSNNSVEAIDTSVLVYPGDKVLVPKAGLVYVLGDVRSPGAYAMSNNSSQLTVLQLVAAAGGTNHSAVPSHARVFRKDGATATGYTNNPLPLSAMQKGKQPDLPMHPGDIIYVPFSYVRNVASEGSGVVAAATSSTIYALP
jgi:polysaccharide export outer membrane protein